jgi:primosomal protein N' (replication factor Y)
MINITVSGTGKELAEKGAARLGQQARRLADGSEYKGRLTVIGPMEAPLGKVRGRYRRQLLVRGKQVRALHAFVRQLIEGADIAGCEIRVDVDPMNFM